jgi:hypothetical protein
MITRARILILGAAICRHAGVLPFQQVWYRMRTHNGSKRE